MPGSCSGGVGSARGRAEGDGEPDGSKWLAEFDGPASGVESGSDLNLCCDAALADGAAPRVLGGMMGCLFLPHTPSHRLEYRTKLDRSRDGDRPRRGPSRVNGKGNRDRMGNALCLHVESKVRPVAASEKSLELR